MFSHNKVYFINLPWSITRRHILRPLLQVSNGEIWPGSFPDELIHQGHLLQYINCDLGTEGATRAHLCLYQHHLKTEKSEYLTIFEDDVFAHKDFCRRWDVINGWLKEPGFSCKLLYLGLGDPCSLKEPQKEAAGLILGRLPKNLRLTGAFGLIIHRSVLPELITLCQEALQLRLPHDFHALGEIQKRYNSESLMISPNLVISDVTSSHIRVPRNQRRFNKRMGWDPRQYLVPRKVPIFVITDGNLHRVKEFLQLFSIFQPLAIPIFLLFKKNQRVRQLFEREEYQQLLRIYLDEPTHLSNKINRLATKFLELDGYADYFGVTNTHISWRLQISSSFWIRLEKALTKYDQVTYRISECHLCTRTEPRMIPRMKFYQGFSFFHRRAIGSLKRISSSKIKRMTESFYSSYSCSRDDLGPLHDLEIDDLIQGCLESDPLLPSSLSLTTTDPAGLEYRSRIFNRWWSDHFVGILNCFLPEKYHLAHIEEEKVTLIVEEPVLNCFNKASFSIHRCFFKRERDQLIISYGYRQMIPVFGKKVVQRLEELITPIIPYLSKSLVLKTSE